MYYVLYKVIYSLCIVLDIFIYLHNSFSELTVPFKYLCKQTQNYVQQTFPLLI